MKEIPIFRNVRAPGWPTDKQAEFERLDKARVDAWQAHYTALCALRDFKDSNPKTRTYELRQIGVAKADGIQLPSYVTPDGQKVLWNDMTDSERKQITKALNL